MSDALEQRVSEEGFGSDEGEEADVESFLEDNSSELMDRLRELEAENSALMLANESQREAYERCLDEVANHVVQALLNQKDLREECIKLKMLVCDLERQNRALCELFQQKLPNHPTTNYQEPAHTEAQAKVSRTVRSVLRPQHASPARGAQTSMDALSPFFKKKAHILEVLRKMEETDPLKFHPSAASLSFCDYSQVLKSTAVLASADPHSLQCKPHHTHTHCHCTRPETEHPQLNGDGAQSEEATKCCSHCKRSPPESPPKACKSVCGSANAQRGGGGAAASSGDGPVGKSRAGAELTGFSPSSHPSIESDPTSSPLIPERDTSDPPSVRASSSISPSSSCLSDVKAVAINSPSKLLKFLKIPNITEKCQSNPNASAVRLSPQLTRNSRIPCRTNNYEVYHSPVPTRRATTTERCRQPPPPPTRSESYPATHSAPTSPPQSEDTLPEKDYASPAKAKMVAPSTNAAATTTAITTPASLKIPQAIPHYENICDIQTGVAKGGEVGVEKRTIPQIKTSVGERKLVKSLPESVLKASNERKQSSSSTTDTTSDDEDSDSPVWVNQQSLPACQPSLKAQTANFARPIEKQDLKDGFVGSIPVATQPPPPTRRSEASSIPKRPGVVAVRSQGDPSQHAFKERAALGKLRSSEDLQVGMKHVETASFGEAIEERNVRTVDRQQATEIQKEEVKFSKYAESDGKKVNERGLKYATPMFEQGMKTQQTPAGGAKQELAKSDGSKSKIGLPSPITDAPQVLRNNIKCPGSLNLAYNVKTTSSPNKIPPKSPSKPCPSSVQRMSKPPETPRYSSKSEERTKISGKGKKNPIFGDSLPPPPPKPPVEIQPEKPVQPATSPQSAIEQKVMKGIEENMLKEQDKVVQIGEVKQKTSNGIASWFGLKKSKLPALSRKADGVKAKDEKREWKINIPSVGRDSVKVASRCKEGVEGLNISTLMEKAEGLRRALEEERQFVERQSRGHSCEVVMDQSQGQLAVMYRGGPGSGASTYTLDSGIGTFPLPECSSGAAGRGLHHGSSPGRASRRSRTLEREAPSQDECYTPHKPLMPSAPYGHTQEGRTVGLIREGTGRGRCV
uniref:Nck-associated protein 5 C-terminal domain-containing protein n=1 Tax=Periophthalmus magnuspinnatus TaxID=409849 RepID=A0A3B4A342_9GOBI